MNQEMKARVQRLLEDKLTMILLSEGAFPNYPPSPAVERKWNDCLEGVGARRVSKLMGIIVEQDAGFVRLKDPLGNSGNHGYIDIDEDSLDKIAALGLP